MPRLKENIKASYYYDKVLKEVYFTGVILGEKNREVYEIRSYDLIVETVLQAWELRCRNQFPKFVVRNHHEKLYARSCRDRSFDFAPS